MSKTMLGKADSAETSINSITQSSSSLRIPVLSETSQEITHPFLCFRCPKRFSSWHALGGHQNAHKKERNEEHRLYNEQRLALKRQSSSITIPSPTPLSIVPPGIINSYDRPKASVFMPAGFENGPTRTGVKGGEVPYEGSQENQNSHPYNYKPINTKLMPLKLYLHEERGFWPKAEEDSVCWSIC